MEERPPEKRKVGGSIPPLSTTCTQPAAGIPAMLKLACTEPGIALAPASLDADPHLLNVGNGTLDPSHRAASTA